MVKVVESCSNNVNINKIYMRPKDFTRIEGDVKAINNLNTKIDYYADNT